jgi:hypothetical protein
MLARQRVVYASSTTEEVHTAGERDRGCFLTALRIALQEADGHELQKLRNVRPIFDGLDYVYSSIDDSLSGLRNGNLYDPELRRIVDSAWILRTDDQEVVTVRLEAMHSAQLDKLRLQVTRATVKMLHTLIAKEEEEEEEKKIRDCL